MRRYNLQQLAALFAVLTTVTAAQAEILVGFAAPLTGPVAWGGKNAQISTEIAVVDLNDQGGLLGEPLKMITVDDYCNGDQAVAAAKKLIESGVVVVIGHQCSGAAIPASKVYAEAGVIMISNFATNPKLTEQGFRNIFRVVGRDDLQGTIAGNYLAEHWGDQKIAILHDGEAYGKGLAEETKKQLAKHAVTVAMYEALRPGKVDYSDLVARMRQKAINVMYYGGYAPEAALILRHAHDLGYDLQLVAGDGIVNEDFGLIAGPAAEGTLITFPPDPPRNPKVATILNKFRSTGYTAYFPRVKNTIFPNFYLCNFLFLIIFLNFHALPIFRFCN